MEYSLASLVSYCRGEPKCVLMKLDFCCCCNTHNWASVFTKIHTAVAMRATVWSHRGYSFSHKTAVMLESLSSYITQSESGFILWVKIWWLKCSEADDPVLRVQWLIFPAVAFRDVPLLLYPNFRYNSAGGRCSPASSVFSLFGGGMS